MENKNTTIQIGSTDIKITYKALPEESEQFYRGYCDILNHHIYINTNQSRKMMQETLLHEILHAIINIYGIEANMEEEVLVRVLTHALQQAGYKRSAR